MPGYGFQYFQPSMYPPQMSGQQMGGQQITQPMPQMGGQIPQAPQTPQNNAILWCQGEAAAKSWMVAPGNSVILMDSEQPYMYLKSVDNYGVPAPLRKFRLTEETQAAQTPLAQPAPQVDYITRKEFDEFKAALNAAKEGHDAEPTV